MTRQEAIDLHLKMLELYKHMRRRANLDIIADHYSQCILLLKVELECLENMTDELFERWTEGLT